MPIVNSPSLSRTAVVNCGQLVTLRGPARSRVGTEIRELAIIDDGAMLIVDGRIKQVGTYAEILPFIDKETQIIDADNRVVAPGFVDAHTHPVFAGNRATEFEQRIAGKTYQEIAASGGGILSTVRNTRAASEDQLLAAASRHAEWFLRGGTTTIEAKSGYGLSLESELASLRVLRRLAKNSPLRIIPTLLAAHTVPPEYKCNRDGYISLIVDEILPSAASEQLAVYCDIFCDEHAFTVDESRTILNAAKSRGLGLRMHVEQFKSDGGALLAAELNAATADHLECTTAASMAALRTAGVQPVLLPASVFALARTQYPDARAMIEHGLAPVVATDFNPGSSPAPSMLFTMSLACIHLRMLPAEAITAATINAAYSLNLGHEIGSLESGKAADFVIHEATDYRELAYFIAAPVRPRVFIAGIEVTAQ